MCTQRTLAQLVACCASVLLAFALCKLLLPRSEPLQSNAPASTSSSPSACSLRKTLMRLLNVRETGRIRLTPAAHTLSAIHAVSVLANQTRQALLVSSKAGGLPFTRAAVSSQLNTSHLGHSRRTLQVNDEGSTRIYAAVVGSGGGDGGAGTRNDLDGVQPMAASAASAASAMSAASATKSEAAAAGVSAAEVSERREVRLFWWHRFGGARRAARAAQHVPCPKVRCICDSRPAQFARADGVVVWVGARPERACLPPRLPSHTWVLEYYESPAYYPELYDASYVREFDLKVSYELDSDVVFTSLHPAVEGGAVPPSQWLPHAHDQRFPTKAPGHAATQLEALGDSGGSEPGRSSSHREGGDEREAVQEDGDAQGRDGHEGAVAGRSTYRKAELVEGRLSPQRSDVSQTPFAGRGPVGTNSWSAATGLEETAGDRGAKHTRATGVDMQATRPQPRPQGARTRAVVWLASNCHSRNRREALVHALTVTLGRHKLPIHSVGKCMHNHDAPALQLIGGAGINSSSMRSKLALLGSYEFCLVAENSLAKDYVTEKIYHAFAAGCLPVYYGSRDVRRILPTPLAAVQVLDFDSVESLAAHLGWLAQNASAYAARLAWRQDVLLVNRWWRSLLRLTRLPETASKSAQICAVCTAVAAHRAAREGRTQPHQLTNAQTHAQTSARTRTQTHARTPQPLRPPPRVKESAWPPLLHFLLR